MGKIYQSPANSPEATRFADMRWLSGRVVAGLPLEVKNFSGELIF